MISHGLVVAKISRSTREQAPSLTWRESLTATSAWVVDLRAWGCLFHN